MSRASVLAAVALGAVGLAHPALGQGAADRYGPPAAGYEPPAPAVYPAAPPPSAPVAMRGRVLSWPGKSDQGAAPAYAPSQPVRTSAAMGYSVQPYQEPRRRFVSAAPYSGRGYPVERTTGLRYSAAYAQPAAAPRAYADLETAGRSPQPRAYARPAYAAPTSTPSQSPDGWRPVFAEAPVRAPAPMRSAGPTLAGAPSSPDAPSSIYTPAADSQLTPAQRAAAAPPPLRGASAAQRYGYDPSQGHQVRFYSVHRPFGLQPDAAPIPPQFFTATADLSQPAGPLPSDRTTTTTTASGTRVSHVAPDTSVN